MAVDSGSYTDATLQSRRRLAEAMMQKGMDTSPISSHWQGLARIANSVMGGYDLHKLDSESKSLEETARKERVAALGLGEVEKQAASLTPPATTSVPISTPQLSTSGQRVEVAPKMWVDKSYKDRFGALLTELEAEGYKVDPTQSGGFNKRNIAGTNIPSQHSHGRAVDINWGPNARGQMGEITARLGKEKINEIARRHGLIWGGNWSNPDPMHFEVDPKWQPPGSPGMLAEGGLPVAPSAPGQSMPPVAGQSMPPVATQQMAQAPGATMTDAPGSALPPNADQIKRLLNSRDKRNQALGMEMLKEWRAQQAKANNPTDEMREYALDIKQRREAGEKDLPTFGKWKADLKRAGATQVSVNQKYESAFEQARGKTDAANYDKLIDAGRSAQQQIASLDSIGQALDVYNSGAKFGTGALGKAEQTVRQWAVALGLADEKSVKTVGAAELAQAVQNRMALQMRDPSGGMGMPGALSNSDREFLSQSQPGIEKTPEGNRIMIENYKKIARRQIEVADMAAKWVSKEGNMRGFEEHLKAWADANPLFPPPKKTAAPTPGARLKYNPATGELE